MHLWVSSEKDNRDIFLKYKKILNRILRQITAHILPRVNKFPYINLHLLLLLTPVLAANKLMSFTEEKESATPGSTKHVQSNADLSISERVKMCTPYFSTGESRKAADDIEGIEEEEELQYLWTFQRFSL